MFLNKVTTIALLGVTALSGAERDPVKARTVITDSRASVSQYLVALPHIAFGGPWRTKIIIRNTSGSPADVTLNYFGATGGPLRVAFGGVSADHTNLTVPANGGREVEPDWHGNENGAWVGFVYTNPGIKIQGVFLWHNPADPTDKYTEAAAPIVSQLFPGCIIPLPGATTTYTMPYDETDGHFSGYGFANTTSNPVTMNLTFYDQNGVVADQYSEKFPGFGHDQFLIRDKMSQLLGRKGTMQITGSGIVALGFRFTPHYTFTTWQP